MKCIKCGAEVSDSQRICASCGTDNGFPNVRKANSDEETSALQLRLDDAFISAKARHVDLKLIEFGNAVKASKAVIARPLTTVMQIFDDDKFSYVSFAKQVKSGQRRPDDANYDPIRNQFENALFPNYYDEIIFGSLSLDGSGLSGYGGYVMVLREIMISDRATVFEENPAVFAKKHRVRLTDNIPPGFRAVWENRHSLAMAKLHSSIVATTETPQFQSILQNDNGGTANSDFIEVHIYGSINSRSVERIIPPARVTHDDRPIWRRIQKNAAVLGVGT